MAYLRSRDPWMEHAKEIIFADDAVRVSMEAKNKDLIKFGRNTLVGTSIATLMTLPSGVTNETYVSTNAITEIISTSTADAESVVVEGQTISGSDFTFVTQTVSLNGRTAVTLATPLCRCTRIYNNDSTELAGTVSVCETGTYTAGVPDTAALVHCQIRATQQQSEKAATTLSSVDYWVITGMHAYLLDKTSGTAEVDLEIRLFGKVFRPVIDISVSDSHATILNFYPYIIVKPNSDIRLRAIADASSTDVGGAIFGALLKA